VGKLMKTIGMEIEIKEAWRVAVEKKKETEMVGIKIEDSEKRKEILDKRRNLRGRRERMEENYGGLDLKGEKNEMEIRGVGKRRGEKGEEG